MRNQAVQRQLILTGCPAASVNSNAGLALVMDLLKTVTGADLTPGLSHN